MPVFISRWVRWVRALLLRCANSSLPNCPIAKFSEIPYKNIQNTSWHFSDLSPRLRSMSCCKPAAHFSGDWRCSFPFGVLLLNRDERSLMQPAMEGGHLVFYHQIEKHHQGPVVNFEVFPANLRAWSCKHNLNVPKWKMIHWNTVSEHGWKDTDGSHLRSSEAAVNLQALKAWRWLLTQHDCIILN